MDPVTAFGTVVNVVTLIEFIAKLAKKSHDVVSGTAEDLNDIEIAAERMQYSLEKLNIEAQPSRQTPDLATARDGSSFEDQLDQIRDDCCHIAQALLRKLHGLRAAPDASRITKVKAGLVAIKDLVTKSYKNLDQRLERHKQQLMFHIILDLQNKSLMRHHMVRNTFAEKVNQLSGSVPANTDYDAIAESTTEVGSIILFIRRSLCFVDIDEREQAIVNVDEHSFSWIFDSKHKFVPWLMGRDTGLLCWISGRPGSGKSTLQKSIYEHSRTRHAVEQWGKQTGAKVLMVRHYFTYAGSSFQKTRIGMLRGILHQICEMEFGLQHELFQEHVDMLRHRGRNSQQSWQLPAWTNEKLRKLVSKLHQILSARNLNIFIQIDGLDECNLQEHEELIEDIKLLIGSEERVKCCLASRDWPVFHDAFSTASVLFLHEHTASTILSLISETLFTNRIFKKLAQMRRERAEDFVHSIRQKANGSIVWVKVAMRELLRGLCNGDTFQELQDGLDALPEDLESLYRTAIDRVHEKYRKDTAVIFAFVSYFSEKRNPSLLNFCLVRDISNRGYAQVVGDPECLDTPDHPTVKRILDSRTGTLVEFDPDHGSMSFIHKTVYDYLATERTQQQHMQWINDKDWSIEKAIAEAEILKLGRNLPFKHGLGGQLIWCIDAILRAPEAVRGGLLQRTKDVLNVKLSEAPSVDEGSSPSDVYFDIFGHEYWSKDGLIHIDQSDDMIGRCQQHWTIGNLALFIREHGYHVLDEYIHFRSELAHSLNSSTRHWTRDSLTRILFLSLLIYFPVCHMNYWTDYGVILTTLRLGADPNQTVFRHHSAWQYLLSVHLSSNLGDRNGIMAELLTYGAVPVSTVVLPLQNKWNVISISYEALYELRGGDPKYLVQFDKGR